MDGSKTFVVQYYALVLSRTICSLSVALGKPEPGESWPAYVGRIRSFSQNFVVSITVRLKNGIMTPVLSFPILISLKGTAPDYHHRDFYYVKKSAAVTPTTQYKPIAVRNASVASHDSLTTFGFATVIRVLAQDGELLVWWSKIDKINFMALLGNLQGDPEDELAQCGWRV